MSVTPDRVVGRAEVPATPGHIRAVVLVEGASDRAALEANGELRSYRRRRGPGPRQDPVALPGAATLQCLRQLRAHNEQS
jgi:hypothetical protein